MVVDRVELADVEREELIEVDRLELADVAEEELADEVPTARGCKARKLRPSVRKTIISVVPLRMVVEKLAAYVLLRQEKRIRHWIFSEYPGEGTR
jgi:hypothetical protein